MNYLLGQLKKYKAESVLAPLFKMLEALFDLFVPLVVADIINTGIAEGDNTYILKKCGILVLLALIGIACSFTAQFFAARAATGCAAGLRHDLFAKIQSLGFSEIDTIGTSTLITRMTSDINQVQNAVNMTLRLFMRSPFIVFGAVIMAFGIDRKIGLIFLTALPVLAIIVFGVMRTTSPLYKKVQGKLDGVVSVTRENLTGVRVVRAFGKEREETARFQKVNEDLTGMQLYVGKISALMNPLTYVVVNLSIIAILRMGAVQVDTGVLMMGDIIALVNYMNQILVELIKLANTVVLISRSMASMNRIKGILDTESSMNFTAAQTTLPDTDEAVSFRNVSLIYAGAGEESIEDITFTAKKGETIGVIGGTGSGKTSLVSLIPRFYDATAGEVRIMGLPAAEWEKEKLRQTVGTVMQKAQLFQGTIRENLKWGNETASDAELWEALEAAQAAEVVRGKKDGLDERVEQGGRNFSGGQRQRLSIARTLAAKPEILILDDSSSALDYATDAALRQALSHLSWKPTVFIVSQRASSLKHADRILVLEDGRIADQGRHEELLDRCEVYREIYESQFEKGGER